MMVDIMATGQRDDPCVALAEGAAGAVRFLEAVDAAERGPVEPGQRIGGQAVRPGLIEKAGRVGAEIDGLARHDQDHARDMRAQIGG